MDERDTVTGEAARACLYAVVDRFFRKAIEAAIDDLRVPSRSAV